MPVRFHDISPPLSPRIAAWPGDLPFRRDVSLDQERGDPITLSALHASVHVGAHVDAPAHFLRGARTVDALALDRFFGPCQVFRVDIAAGGRVLPSHLAGPVQAPRVLIRTGSFPDPDRWTPDFCGLSVDLVDHLHARGVTLIGVDTPSVDPFHDEVLHAHRAIGRYDMAVLEGLALGAVESGLYRLVAFPLRIEGADAAPVRAVLLEEVP